MIPFPNKKYSVIYADPPWSYQDKRCNGNAADHYPTMRIEDICSLPVQLPVIERCIDLWTNPGDIALDPFDGIGSTGYQALKMGRRHIGVELKESYFRQAAMNLATAESEYFNQEAEQ